MGAALLRPGSLSDGTVLRYGMGIETSPVAGHTAFSRAGSTASYRAWLGLLPADGLSVALLCNSGAVNTEDLGVEIAARHLPPALTTCDSRQANVTVSGDPAGFYRNIANDSLVEAKADASGLHFNSGVAFRRVAPGRLATADGKRSVVVTRGANGQRFLSVTRIGNSSTILEGVASWRPRLVELRRLTGSYGSSKIDGIQVIGLNGDALVWRDPLGTAHPLVPPYRNTFMRRTPIGRFSTLR